MPIDWQPFVGLVRRHQRFLLTTHVRPDGDGLGSILALGEVLEQQGKQVRLLSLSNVPPRYHFLDPEGRIIRYQPPGDAYRDAEAVVIMDTGTWNQLADFSAFLKGFQVPKAVIDHHPTQDLDLEALRLVDTSVEATGRLAFDAIQALGGRLSERAASNLFVALAMDTGWFRFPNTTPATFRLAAELEQAGAKPEILYDLLFEQNSLPRLKLTGLVLSRMQVSAGGQLAYTEILLPDYAATGARPPDTEDLINYTRSIMGVEVGVMFMEQFEGGVKVSLRAKSKVDVRRVAEQFGGGGHKLAAGAVVQGTIDEVKKRVLAAVEAALAAGK
jgi:bifunctional oligoribonuclease and PAP phosphatase NrnA